jgi:hypothetical protein
MTTPLTFLGVTPSSIESIRESADTEQRQANAWLDQHPVDEVRKERIQQYIHLAALATCMAILDDDGVEPPVPHRIIRTESTFHVPYDDGPLGQAWRDIPGVEFHDSLFLVDTLEMPGVPIYRSSSPRQENINQTLTEYESWFISAVAQSEKDIAGRMLHFRRAETNKYILHIIGSWNRKEVANGQAGGFQITYPWDT